MAKVSCLAPKANRPVEKLVVAAAVGWEGASVEAAADCVEGDGDVHVLVGVDADDDSTATRVGAHACHWDLQLRPGRVDATLAGRVDGTVTRPVAIRLL